MGYKHNTVEYGFGQWGSAFVDASANTIVPPEGQVIIAIQFLANTELSALTTEDTNTYPSIGSAAHSGGAYTRTVDGASSSNLVQFDQENAGTSNSDNIEIGDKLYTEEGVFLGTVTALDPNGDNTKEINRSTTTFIGNNATVVFKKTNKLGFSGVGGMAIDSSNTFPKGVTIYGRWDSVSMNDNDGMIIAYFGD
jgi:hypothetical protein